MNTVVIGNTIQDIASSVANSKWAKSLVPTIEELNETIANNSKLSSSLHTENIQQSLANMFQGINISEEEAIKMAQTVNAKNYQKAIDDLSKSIAANTDKPVDRVIERAKTVVERELSKKVDIDLEGIGGPAKVLENKIKKYPKAYFMNPDKDVRKARIGTAVGGYAAVSIGGRYLQGGTLTTDEYGRKDIAGIPFL